MTTLKVAYLKKSIIKLFSDENLTKKAFLNSITSVLEYIARLIVAFVVQPWLVGGLGDYFFGTWQILVRFVGYITPASGRPTQALRWTLANQLNSDDLTQKRLYVGSAITVWVIFLPILTVLGSLLTWFIPLWINTPAEYIWIVRITTGILVINLIMINLTAIPQSVLQGENLGYKRMGASTLLIFAGGGLTWLAIYLDTGIIGIAIVTLLITIINGLFYLQVVRRYSHWFGVTRPSISETKSFFKISGWFLLWNLIVNLMMASDVVILGVLNSVESVTSYSLTKYAPETLISMIAIITFGIAPGMGGIIGAGDKKRASRVRGELMAITWLVTVALGSTLIIWNQAFLSLWVGTEYYPGMLANFLIVIVVMQFVFIRNDSNIIDLTLKLQQKVLLGAISVVVSLASAVLLVGFFNLAIIGVSLGLIIGRLILSIGYPILAGRHLDIPWISQIKNILRPALLTLLILIFAAGVGKQFSELTFKGISGWIIFAFSGSVTFFFSISLAFRVGLSKNHRQLLIIRIKNVIPRS